MIRTWPRSRRAVTAGVVGLMLAGALAGCDGRADGGRRAAPQGGKDVGIRTPLGSLSVRTGTVSPDTGLSVYAGARPLRDPDGDQGADVEIDTPLFGLQVSAAKFETDDDTARVVSYYRTELARYGDVTECRGALDFDRRGQPRCRGREGRDIHLMVGDENRHRLVTVTPRGGGAEFALVRVETRPGED